MKDVVFNENENAIVAIGDDNNITNTKLDRFMANNDIRNRSKARTKEQKVQVLLKLRQMNTVFTTMYSKETPLRKNCSKGKGSKGTKPKFVTKTGTIYRPRERLTVPVRLNVNDQLLFYPLPHWDLVALDSIPFVLVRL